ncbi:hypothetical protein [Undibacterium curvum]|uniref:Uncharacterized protein n=1 Tax=Undibacterium curvum TaxID=2762294 RepID=A0ABR7A4C2_9BURK|nr:hypothetical protein [Undibacterium curvum]MBC3931497.1 hypothetical protein [Undibacterium curvum]
MTPIDKFKTDWQKDALTASFCEAIFCHLCEPKNRLEHFSFARLKAIANSDNEEKLATALQYLSSPRCFVLKQIFLFFDNDDVTEFSSSEMVEIFRNGAFVHPSQGVVVRDLNQILVAFEVGDFFSQSGLNAND